MSARVPSRVRTIRPPASAAAIADVERELGCTLPPDLAASLGLHDGQDRSGFELLGTWGLYPLVEIVRVWRMFGDMVQSGIVSGEDDRQWVFPKGPVRPRTWDPARIPFAYDGGGTHLVVDMNPDRGGSVGQ